MNLKSAGLWLLYGAIGGFIAFVAVLEDIMQSMANTFASIFDRVAQAAASKWGVLVLTLVAFVVAQATLTFGVFPAVVGACALGVLAGFALWGWNRMYLNPYVETHTETIERLIPYDQWPDSCYICGDDITKDMEVRGQFVIHKGESEAETKAAPLCDECTWTYSTLAEYHEELIVGEFDRRENPVEL